MKKLILLLLAVFLADVNIYAMGNPFYADTSISG